MSQHLNNTASCGLEAFLSFEIPRVNNLSPPEDLGIDKGVIGNVSLIMALSSSGSLVKCKTLKRIHCYEILAEWV